MYTRDEMLSALQNNVCEVLFTKSNGEERLMECTLMRDEIPEEMMPKTDGNTVAPNLDIVKAFDVEINQWRSFRVDSVIEFRGALIENK